MSKLEYQDIWKYPAHSNADLDAACAVIGFAFLPEPVEIHIWCSKKSQSLFQLG